VRSLVVALVLAASAPGPRAAADCAQDADRLRAHLVEAAPRVHTWNFAWAIGFGGAAAIQVALAATETNPFGAFTADYQETLYVGAAKAAIGAAARFVLPLHVEIPPPVADRCVELAALRSSLETIARKERRTFWLTHLGGLALNLSGAALLWHRRSFAVGATSFAISFPIGPISAYTMPRSSWHRWRDEHATWAVAISPHDGGGILSIRGQL
jgi:hypothetical protein